jgi:flagellin
MISATSNLSALVGLRMYAQQTDAVNKSMQRLATGKRINRAADDPSGLIAADNMAARTGAIRKQVQGLEFGQQRIAATEGGYSVISDMLVELDALVVQAANTGATSREERGALQLEADAIVEGIGHILSTSRFNGELLFDGRTVDSAGSITGTLNEVFDLGDLKSGGALNLVDGDLSAAQELTKATASNVSETRAGLGSLQKNYYDSEINSLYRELGALSETESLIRDTDYAREVTELVRAQILQEAALRTILIARDQSRSAALALLS